MTPTQRDAIDACMREAGQPAPEWRQDAVYYLSDGSTIAGWMHHTPLEVHSEGDVEQWHAYYRQALIVIGCLPPGYYDDKPGCPVGRLPDRAEVSP